MTAHELRTSSPAIHWMTEALTVLKMLRSGH